MKKDSKKCFFFLRKHAYSEVYQFSIFDDIFDNFDFFFTIFNFSAPNKNPIDIKNFGRLSLYDFKINR